MGGREHRALFQEIWQRKEIKPEEGSVRGRETRGNVCVPWCLEGSRQEYVLVGGKRVCGKRERLRNQEKICPGRIFLTHQTGDMMALKKKKKRKDSSFSE